MKAKFATRNNKIGVVIPKAGTAAILLAEGLGQQHGLAVEFDSDSEVILALFDSKDHEAAIRVCAYINANL